MIDLNFIHEKINSLFSDISISQNEKEADNEFSQISELLPYRYYDDVNRLFINENSLGFIFESSPLIGANPDTTNSLSGVFSDAIPNGCTIQFINYASPRIGHIFERWQQPRTKKGGVYEKLAKKRIEHFSKSNMNSVFDSSPYTFKNFRLIISVSIPFNKPKNSEDMMKDIIALFSSKDKKDKFNIQDLINKLSSLKQKLHTSLKTAGIYSYEMSPDNLINFLDEIINFRITSKKDFQQYQEDIPLNKQIVSKENSLRVGVDHLELFHDDKNKKINVRSLVPVTYPIEWYQWQCRDLIGDFYQDLRRMECPFITSFSVTIPYNEQSLKAGLELKSNRLTALKDSPVAKFSTIIRDSAEELKHFNDNIKKGQRMFKTCYQILIFAKDDKIDESEEIMKSIYLGKGWKLQRDKFLSLQSFLAVLPFKQSEGIFEDLKKFDKIRTRESENCANLAPLQGEWKGMESPCMMLYGRRGQPLFWDPFKNTEGNYNVAVIGKSGSGKSVFMQELVTSILGYGGKVYVIDDGRSFMKSAQLQGGEFIEFSDKSRICLNPFSVVDEKVMAENAEYKGEVIGLIRSMVRQMCEGIKKDSSGNSSITQIQERYIEEAVQIVWEKKKTKATITDVKNYFDHHEDKRAKDLSILVKPYTKEGIYARFFEGQSNIKISNIFMVFELAELKNKKELQSIVMMFLMFLISENMYFGDRKTPITLLIDEAWDLLHGEGSSTFIEGLARRARKYCGNIVTGTQSVNDYYKTNATIAAFENTDWIVLLMQKKESIKLLEESKRINMDENFKKDLLSLKMVDGNYSEAIIYGPQGYAVTRLILDPYSATLYSSKPEIYAKVNDLVEAGFSIADAIEKICLEKQQNRKFFHYKDYQKLSKRLNDKENIVSFEDALEEMVADRISEVSPQLFNKIYNLK